MANYDSIDLDWTWDGDMAIDQTGDLQDTSADFLTSLITEVQTVLKSESLDWEKDPMLGSNLPDFVGFPNTRETAEAIEARVKNALISQGIVQAGDIGIRVVPVHANQILLVISIRALATARNGLVPGQLLKVNMVYDTMEGGIFFLNQGTGAK